MGGKRVLFVLFVQTVCPADDLTEKKSTYPLGFPHIYALLVCDFPPADYSLHKIRRPLHLAQIVLLGL